MLICKPSAEAQFHAFWNKESRTLNVKQCFSPSLPGTKCIQFTSPCSPLLYDEEVQTLALSLFKESKSIWMEVDEKSSPMVHMLHSSHLSCSLLVWMVLIHYPSILLFIEFLKYEYIFILPFFPGGVWKSRHHFPKWEAIAELWGDSTYCRHHNTPFK